MNNPIKKKSEMNKYHAYANFLNTKMSHFFAKKVTILRREKKCHFLSKKKMSHLKKKITILFNKTLLKSLIIPTHRNTNEK
jgi:hypothetical protein